MGFFELYFYNIIQYLYVIFIFILRQTLTFVKLTFRIYVNKSRFQKDHKSSRNDKYYMLQTAFLLEYNISVILFKLLIRCEVIQCYFLKWGFSIYSFITLFSFYICFSYSFCDKQIRLFEYMQTQFTFLN